jgi:hypothetical protein
MINTESSSLVGGGSGTGKPNIARDRGVATRMTNKQLLIEIGEAISKEINGLSDLENAKPTDTKAIMNIRDSDDDQSLSSPASTDTDDSEDSQGSGSEASNDTSDAKDPNSGATVDSSEPRRRHYESKTRSQPGTFGRNEGNGLLLNHVNLNISEIAGMRDRANIAYKQINFLIDLKLKHNNVIDSKKALSLTQGINAATAQTQKSVDTTASLTLYTTKLAEKADKEGRTVMVFTVVTIIFVSTSFPYCSYTSLPGGQVCLETCLSPKTMNIQRAATTQLLRTQLDVVDCTCKLINDSFHSPLWPLCFSLTSASTRKLTTSLISVTLPLSCVRCTLAYNHIMKLKNLQSLSRQSSRPY